VFLNINPGEADDSQLFGSTPISKTELFYNQNSQLFSETIHLLCKTDPLSKNKDDCRYIANASTLWGNVHETNQRMKMKYWIGAVLCLLTKLTFGQPSERLNLIKATKGMVALWDFKEEEGQPRKAVGNDKFPLQETNGTIPRLNEGPLSGFSAELGTGSYFSLAHSETGALNIHGINQGVTVVAWVKWTGEQTGFVGGMWNEYQDGGKRQYGLFVSLPYYNGKNQVCGHISKTGKPTSPFPFSIDYSASKQEVPANEWVCVAFTYDGKNIKSYVDGVFEKRDPELINNTKGFEGYPNGLIQSKNPYYFPDGIGNNGSDFTVGAVLLKSGMGNFFKGQIGGLAVFNRALRLKELKRLANK
jgi:hypothetical protein